MFIDGVAVPVEDGQPSGSAAEGITEIDLKVVNDRKQSYSIGTSLYHICAISQSLGGVSPEKSDGKVTRPLLPV